MPVPMGARGRGRIIVSRSRASPGSTARVRPGEMCRSGSESGTRSTSASRAGPRTAPGRGFSPRCRSSPTRPGSLTGWCRSTRPSRACISTVRPSAAPQGALSNHKNLREEPLDHGIGRSRGGLTSKVHLVCDGRGRPLSWVITGGNINDTTMTAATLDQMRVPRPVGRPRQRPDRVIADKGYPSKKNRAWLQDRKIAATIPEREDQIGHRRKKPGQTDRVRRRPEGALQGPKRRRAVLQQAQAMARHSDALRQNRARLPWRDHPRRATLIWIKTDLIHTA